MLELDVDLAAALGQLDGLAERVGQELRPATLAGAMLVRREAEERAPRSEAAHWFYSRRNKDGTTGRKYLFEPGSLKKAIYIRHIDENSLNGQREEYKIGWRKNPSNKGYVPYAHMVEYGTVRTPAQPFLRPAFDAMRQQAEQLIIERIKEAARGKDHY